MSISNIKFTHAGGGNPHYAKVELKNLDSIPELVAQYPEFSMFKELPAWGIFIKHARNIQMKNITMKSDRKDFRYPIVLDDVKQSSFTGIKVLPITKNIIYQSNTSAITIK